MLLSGVVPSQNELGTHAGHRQSEAAEFAGRMVTWCWSQNWIVWAEARARFWRFGNHRRTWLVWRTISASNGLAEVAFQAVTSFLTLE
jgi:hypothetical protein